MATNILALPLVAMTVDTVNNEDWIDTVTFLVDDGTENPPPLDLTGINFQMEVRPKLEGAEVVIDASTANGELAMGDYPNIGTLIIHVDNSKMRLLRVGQYVGDILANDDSYTRTAIQFTLNVAEGSTR
jgi:hypothetical protein